MAAEKLEQVQLQVGSPIGSPTQITSSNYEAIGPPPDGGKGWLQVAVASLALFNTYGWLNSYGIFEQYYSTQLGLNLSAISWMGSIQVCFLALVGAFSGRMFDAGYFRTLISTGSFLQVLGVFMASLATKYWQLFLAQGVCAGLGAGLIYCPILSCIATYFAKKRALAVALVTSGSAVGGVIYPLIAQQLTSKVGFPWTMRVMGFVMMFNAAVIMTFARARLPPRPSGPLVEWAAFKELPYTLYTAGIFFLLLGVYLIYSYINHYGETILGMDRASSLTALLIANAMGFPGRVGPALLSDAYFGPFNTLVPLASISGILYFGWIGIQDSGGLLAFAVLSGLVNGGTQGIAMTGIPTLTADLSKVGTRSGMVMTIISISCLIGPPIAGALVDVADGDYLYMQIWSGCVMIIGAGFVTASSRLRDRAIERE